MNRLFWLLLLPLCLAACTGDHEHLHEHELPELCDLSPEDADGDGECDLIDDDDDGDGPLSIHGDGRETPIDMGDMPCATDEFIDWSVHDLLLFVSIPAW